VSPDVEYCRAQAAEFHRRAEATNDVLMKAALLEIANYWDELRSEYEVLDRSKKSD
jgi:hypothetical protein